MKIKQATREEFITMFARAGDKLVKVSPHFMFILLDDESVLAWRYGDIFSLSKENIEALARAVGLLEYPLPVPNND